MKKLVYFLLGASLMLTQCGSPKEEDSNKTPQEAEKVFAQSVPPEEYEETIIQEAIFAYCTALNEGNYQGLEALFAPEVSQWITLKNTTPQAIAAESKRFLSTKKQVNYTVDFSKMQSSDQVVTLPMTIRLDDYEAVVDAAFTFTPEYKIAAYIEKSIQKQRGSLQKSEPKTVKGKLLLKMKEVSPPIVVGEKPDNNFYVSTMGGTEEMELFEADFGVGTPAQIAGRIDLNDGNWLILGDLSYRFGSSFLLITYDSEGNVLDKLSLEEEAPLVQKDLVISTAEGNYRVDASGMFVKQ